MQLKDQGSKMVGEHAWGWMKNSLQCLAYFLRRVSERIAAFFKIYAMDTPFHWLNSKIANFKNYCSYFFLNFSDFLDY
jgi:hypothetical protein